jgi:hypothetical protein
MSTDPWSRRDFFSWAASGLGGAALAHLFMREGLLRADDTGRVPSRTHFPPRAKRAIHICLLGGLSHVDSFDYKPELDRLHGRPLPSTETPDTFFGKVGLLRKSDWAFRQRGKSGLWISDLFPNLAEEADQLCLIRSMVADSANHTPATFQENTGFRLNGFPSMGAWLSYGLGCETDQLPAYVVLPDPRGLPAAGTINWSSGFLPARYQGVAFRSRGTPIPDLFPARGLEPGDEQASRELLREMNRNHLERRKDDDVLAARLESYELAAKMQMAVPRVADLAGESAETRALYGTDRESSADLGGRCLLARRLFEQGVRFVQIFSGGSFGSPRINWDAHENVRENHAQEAARIDQPVAGLLRDLRRRGMLEDTLLLFTTEFGRTPFTESAAGTVGPGRDHNMPGFTVWMAGAGVKAGFSYGATDPVGWKSVEKPVPWPDFHATVLHLLGIDHERLTTYHNGIQRRLTNVSGRVVRDLLQ